MVEVHFIVTIFHSDEWIVHYHTTVTFDDMAKHVVDGRLSDDAVAWFGEYLQGKA